MHTATVTFNNRSAGFRVPRTQASEKVWSFWALLLLLSGRWTLTYTQLPSSLCQCVPVPLSLKVCKVGGNKAGWHPLPSEAWPVAGNLEPRALPEPGERGCPALECDSPPAGIISPAWKHRTLWVYLKLPGKDALSVQRENRNVYLPRQYPRESAQGGVRKGCEAGKVLAIARGRLG